MGYNFSYFDHATPPGIQPGSVDITSSRGSNWVNTNICSKYDPSKDDDKKEWINFDTLMTSSSQGLFNPFNYDHKNLTRENTIKIFKDWFADPGSNSYSLNTENSQGCEGYHISFVLSTSGYWNDDHDTNGCGPNACTYRGY